MPEIHNENVPLKENGIAAEETMETAIVKPRHKWTKYQKVHLAITLVLFAVCIALIGIYVIELSSQKRKTSSPVSRGEDVCVSPECVSIAAQVLTYAKPSADPCVNFYDYACGGWISKRYIPDSKYAWDTFFDLSEANDKLLKEMLVNKSPNASSRAEVQLYNLYASCLNTKSVDALGLQPLKNLIKKTGLWEALIGTWDEASWDMIETLVKVHSVFTPTFYVDTRIPLFDIRVAVDITDSTQQIIKVSQPGGRALRLSSQDSNDVGSNFISVISTIAKQLGGKDVANITADIVKLDNEIRKGFMPNAQKRKVRESRARITIKELNEATNKTFDWLRYLKLAFKKTGVKITENTHVAIQPLVYLKKMTQALSKASNKVIANYFIWTLIAEMRDYLPTTFETSFFNAEKVLYGTVEQDPRWQRCLRKVESNMGMALGALFVKDTISDADKREVAKMIEDIKNAFLSTFRNTDWMDAQTKKSAIIKAKAVVANVAYPSFIKDPEKLEKYYKGISLYKDQYFDNMVKLLRFEKERGIMTLAKGMNRQEWELAPTLVNAFYDSGRNKMVFLAGILQSPFFNRNAPKSINYGGIGVVMGHEMSHGFDDQGRLFDEKGNLVSWWSEKSAKSFKEREKCIREQYGRYSLFNISVNPNLTMGENIADNSAIKVAFKAYKDVVKQSGPSMRLPGVNMTHDQLFFLASAQVWCSSERRAYTEWSLKEGTHSLGVFRVGGPLSNSEDFAKAFNCKPGTPMNPIKKCSVW